MPNWPFLSLLRLHTGKRFGRAVLYEFVVVSMALSLTVGFLLGGKPAPYSGAATIAINVLLLIASRYIFKDFAVDTDTINKVLSRRFVIYRGSNFILILFIIFAAAVVYNAPKPEFQFILSFVCGWYLSNSILIRNIISHNSTRMTSDV